MHLIQIIRSYMGVSQQELARRVGITQADLCEMEIKPPYGRLDIYQRLSSYLGIPIHALVNNDRTLVPLSFFENSACSVYKRADQRRPEAWEGWRGSGTHVRKKTTAKSKSELGKVGVFVTGEINK